jgi:hypothetical protein
VIVTLEGPLRAGVRALPGAWLGGLGGTCAVVEIGATHASLDLKLPPLGAYALCGQPLRSLAGEFVALDDLFGAAGRRLEERLREADDWDGGTVALTCSSVSYSIAGVWPVGRPRWSRRHGRAFMRRRERCESMRSPRSWGSPGAI